MPYAYNKLKGRIVEKYGTRKKFCEVLKMSENSMSLKLSGKTGFSQKEIIRWSELLDISIDELTDYFFE